MAYEIGTADGYTDLLERLKDFISDPTRIIGDHPNMDELEAIDDILQSGEASQAWTVDRWTDDRDSSGDGEIEMIAHGPGSGGADEIYVGVDTVSDSGNDWYNWRLMGMTGYADVALANMPGMIGGRLPRMLMYNHTLPIRYWFLGNGRRFVVVAKVGSVYECCYLGFALPYGLSTQFPYPLVVGGSACPGTTAADNRHSSTAADHRAFPNPYSYTEGSLGTGVFDSGSDPSNNYGTLRVLEGTVWVKVRNKSGTSSYYLENINWPYISHRYGSIPTNYWSLRLRENIDGSYPVFPIITMLQTPTKHIYGELQGCFAVPGFGGIVAEDTFTVNGDTYIAFPIVPTAERSDWWAIKKE